MDAATVRNGLTPCTLRALLMPMRLTPAESARLDAITLTQHRMQPGQPLYHAGQPFDSLYAISAGFLKTFIASRDGREQVIGFHMPGELLGFDGIASDAYQCTAISLGASDIFAIPFYKIEALARDIPVLQMQMHRIMSLEIVREQELMLLLGNMLAEERLAAFLLNLLQRFHARGYSSSEVILQMSREEIGSYLGMKIETVSRAFSRLTTAGMLEVKHRHVRILDAERLRTLPAATPGLHEHANRQPHQDDAQHSM